MDLIRVYQFGGRPLSDRRNSPRLHEIEKLNRDRRIAILRRWLAGHLPIHGQVIAHKATIEVTDLENWVVEAEGMEGNVETLTAFFVRTASEIYYRVAETQ